LGDAMMSLYDGAETYADYVRTSPEHSLVAQGFVGKPTAPMLLIAGALDTQVPISDVELWLRSGDTPKEAWIHAGGGHMGRDAVTWRDPVIFAQVTTPWLLRVLSPTKGPSA
jgi:fermentation-respiration switch protein FrsA (DUF1100 family)